MASQSESPVPTYAFVFDGTRCTGCKTCALACKDAHNLDETVSYRQVYEYEGGGWAQDETGAWTTDGFTYYVSLACNHCAEPACTQVCPTGAMYRNELGFVTVDDRRCVGCGYCALACPYHAPKVDRAAGHSVKCDGCTERVAAGLEPVCVEACPQRALAFGELVELAQEWGDGEEFAPLPPFSCTRPMLIARAPRGARPCDDREGRVVNVSELV